LAGIRPGIRVSYLNNFATLLDRHGRKDRRKTKKALDMAMLQLKNLS
jgi:hypothetical protein